MPQQNTLTQRIIVNGAGQTNQALIEVFVSRILESLTPEIISGSQIYETPSLVEESTVSEINYIHVPTYKLDCEYNYYTDYYEDITKQQTGILESGLPNLYIYGDDLNKENPIYKEIITANDKIDIDTNGSNNFYEYFDSYAKEYQKTVINPSSEINSFNIISSLESRIYYTKNGLKRFENINKNQFLMPYGNKVNFKTNEISIFSSILEDTDFIDTFCTSVIDYDQKTFEDLALNILSEQTVKNNDKIETVQTISQQILKGKKFSSINEFMNVIKSMLTSSSSTIMIGDTTQKSQKQVHTNHIVNTPNISVAQRRNSGNQSNSISRAIRLAVFSKRLSQFIKKQTLSPSDFLAGAQFYTETFMYQLDKIDTDGTVIQSFYMPNLLGIDTVNLFDSQVKFGKRYNYSLKSYNFSIGQKINIDLLKRLTFQQWIEAIFKARTLDPIVDRLLMVLEQSERPPPSVSSVDALRQAVIETRATSRNINNVQIPSSFENIRRNPRSLTPPGRNLIHAVITQFENLSRTQELDFSQIRVLLSFILEALQSNGIEPFIYYPIIFKKEMFNDTMAVYDHPPSPPEIQIDGMMGIDDKILLRLNSSISEFKAVPVLIQSEDAEIYERNVLIQKLNSLEDQMLFDGDDRPSHFQIFRLDYHPKDYSEFKDNFVIASTTYIDDVGSVNCEACNIIKTNHSSYLDTIRSNQKYYYMFRTVDVHGNISNPSPIYEVQMINEDGTIFPLIKTVDLLKIEDKQPTKAVRRFLHIIPNALQSLVNENQSNYFDENNEIKDSAELVKDSVVLGLTEQKVWNKNYRLKIKSKVTGKVIEIDFKFTHKTLPNPAICE